MQSIKLPIERIARKLLDDCEIGDDLKSLIRIQRFTKSHTLQKTIRKLVKMASVAWGRPRKIFSTLRELRAEGDYDEEHLLLELYTDFLFPEGISFFASPVPAKRNTLKNGQFPYIPSYVSALGRLKHTHPEFFEGSHFIDIGCGIGDKVFAAEFLTSGDMQCEGIEADHATYNIADRVLRDHYNRIKAKFHLGDALKFNFETYDRVYTYLPMESCQELYEYVWSQLLPGTMWYEFDDGLWQCVAKKMGAKRITKHLYQVPKKRKVAKPKKKKKKKETTA